MYYLLSTFLNYRKYGYELNNKSRRMVPKLWVRSYVILCHKSKLLQKRFLQPESLLLLQRFVSFEPKVAAAAGESFSIFIKILRQDFLPFLSSCLLGTTAANLNLVSLICIWKNSAATLVYLLPLTVLCLLCRPAGGLRLRQQNRHRRRQRERVPVPRKVQRVPGRHGDRAVLAGGRGLAGGRVGGHGRQRSHHNRPQTHRHQYHLQQAPHDAG